MSADERQCEGSGRPRAQSGGKLVIGLLGQPPFSVFGLRDGRLVAAVAVDDSTAVRAARRIIDRRIPVDPDELTDSTTDLRKLLKRDVPLRETATRR